MKEQAAQSILNGSVTINPNHEKYYGKLPSHPQDVHSWFHHQENSEMERLFSSNLHNQGAATMPYCTDQNGFMNPNSFGNSYENSAIASFGEASHSMGTFEQWSFQDSDDLQSVAFGYIQNS